jgi:hypothetical protein
MADVPLLLGSCPCRLVAVSHQPHYSLTSDSGLSTVQSSKLLLALTSKIILGFGPRWGPWPYFFLSRLSGLSTGAKLTLLESQHGLHRKHRFQQFFYCCDHETGASHCLAMDVFAESFPSNGYLSGFAILPLRCHVTICTVGVHGQISSSSILLWRNVKQQFGL